MRRRVMVVAALLASSAPLAPQIASAEGLLDFFFNPGKQQQRQAPAQANFFDSFGLNQQPAPPPRPVATAGSGPAFCVRSCDGKYFPVTARSGVQPPHKCPGVF